MERALSPARGVSRNLARLWTALAVLGALGLLYLIALEHLPLVHNAFHDVRHASGFPCH